MPSPAVYEYLLHISSTGASAMLAKMARKPRTVKMVAICEGVLSVCASRSINDGPMIPRLIACNKLTTVQLHQS